MQAHHRGGSPQVGSEGTKGLKHADLGMESSERRGSTGEELDQGWVRAGEGPPSSSVRAVEGGKDGERPIGLIPLHRVSPRVLVRSELWFPWISPEDMVYRWTLDWSLCNPPTQPDPGFSSDKHVL